MGKPEAIVEGYLAKQAAAYEILCRKVVWQGRLGAPDRFLARNGRMCFVECKALGEELRETQVQEILRLRLQGVVVFTVDNRVGVDKVIAWLRGGEIPRVVESIVV